MNTNTDHELPRPAKQLLGLVRTLCNERQEFAVKIKDAEAANRAKIDRKDLRDCQQSLVWAGLLTITQGNDFARYTPAGFTLHKPGISERTHTTSETEQDDASTPD